MVARALVVMVLCGGATPACTGAIGDAETAGPGSRPAGPPGQGGTGGSTGAGPVVPSPDTGLRRLTRTEYNNTVRDLVGDTSQPGNALNPDSTSNGFDNNADLLNLSFAVDQYDVVAADIVENAFRTGSASRKKVLGACDPVGSACAARAVSAFARRAWRRPVTAEEVADLMTALDDARAQGDSIEEGVKLAVRIALVSPNFLYRVEADPLSATGRYPVSPHELATRLSYFLWSSMPDDQLFAAADAAGDANLGKPGVFAAELVRMLDDPKAAALVSNFAAQWLDTRKVGALSPDPKLFSAFYSQPDDLKKAMVSESQLFFREFLTTGLNVVDMLATDFTFANDRLARHYGLVNVTGSQMRKVQLDAAANRFGLLSQAGLLAVTSNVDRTSPVKRGKWVLSRLLCSPPPPPPANVPPLPADPQAATLPLRRRLEAHRSRPECAACHAAMDSIGFALEHYNAVGVWRDAYPKGAIDATGELSSPDGSKLTFDGAADLSRKLKQDPRLARCFAGTVFAYALGRDPTAEGDRTAIDRLAEDLGRGGGRIRELIARVASSNAFQLRGGER